MKNNFKYIFKLLKNKISFKLEKSTKITERTLFYFKYKLGVLHMKKLINCFIINLNKIKLELIVILIKISLLFKKFLIRRYVKLNLTGIQTLFLLSSKKETEGTIEILL